MMRRVLVSLALASAVLAGLAHSAAAQMADALGKPLPVSTLSQGTVSVRVIAGAPDQPLVGVDVKLVGAEGSERTARTDAEGRATFSGLEPGSRYVAKAYEPAQDGMSEPREAVSEQFSIPQEGGLRLMVSTRPWQGGGAAAAQGGGMGGAGAMDPRRMSGVPRGDPAVGAGQMTVAAVRGQVSNRLPGHMIHLIGYGTDGSVKRTSVLTDEEGRATFTNLRSRSVAYYALATFLRGGDDGVPVIDRVVSEQVSLPPQLGVRLLLAGLPDDSLEPAVDDLDRLAPQALPIRPDQVLTQLFFRAPPETLPSSLSLFEVLEGDEAPRLVSTSSLQPPMPVDVTGTISDTSPAAELAAGTLSVRVLHEDEQLAALRGVTVTVTPAIGEATHGEQLTDEQGVAGFTELKPGSHYRISMAVYGGRIESPPIAMPETGGLRVTATINTQILSSADVLFSNVPADRIYFVEGQFDGRVHRTQPFQMIPGRGAVMPLILHSNPLLSFHLSGWIDDEYMGYQVQFTLFNPSAIPWDPGHEGVFLPFPKGFVGGRVEEDMAAMVKVVPERGLIWRGPLPPGSVQFNSGFSMAVDDGTVGFSLDLPLGVYSGNIMLLKTPGMQLLDITPGLRAFERQARNGRDLFVINNINMPQGQRIHFTITGLPGIPAAQRYMGWLAGALGLMMLAWAMKVVLTQRRGATVMAGDAGTDKDRLRKLTRRREDLLDELVALESKKKSGDVSGDAYSKARAKLRKQLESVYTELDQLARDQSAA